MKMMAWAGVLAAFCGQCALAQEVLWDTQFGDSDYDLDVDGTVRALAVYDGELYAAGSFVTAGGVTVNNIARFDGTSWSDVDGGFGLENVGNATVRSMAVANGELFVSGDIETAGMTSVYNVARWDGSSWADASDGLPASMDPDDVETFGLLSFASGGGDRLVLALRIESYFYVYEWSTGMESWSQLGADGFDVIGYIGPKGLAVYDGYLYAFPASCDTTLTDFYDGVARLPLNSPTGAWEATLVGSPEGPEFGPQDGVEFDGELFLAGEGVGSSVGSTAIGPVQSWDGSAYTGQIDDGISYNYYAIAVWDGCSSDTVYVGGNVAASGLNVQVLGMGGWAVPSAGAATIDIYDIVEYDGDLYFGGWSGSVGLNDVSGVAKLSCRCPSDWNGDGATDSSDYLDYLNDYGNMDPSADIYPPGAPDNTFDSSDFLAFLNLGC